MNPTIKSISTIDPEYPQMLTLRDQVLRLPLGMSVYEDDLTKDKTDLMMVAIEGLEVVGCVMLKKVDAVTGKLRQMAVAEKWQGKGLGKKIVAAIEDAALRQGYQSIELSARETAISFYMNLGYRAEGALFTEVGIPHRLMKKRLL